MSRIGNKFIALSKGTTVEVLEGNVVHVKGPKGTLSQVVDSAIAVNVTEDKVTLTRSSEQGRDKAMHGLFRALINNMVEGVSTGFRKELELVGVGYKAEAQKEGLELKLGYSHSILFVMPPEVSFKAETAKGKNPVITLEGIDKQLVGQIAAKLRSLRKPEPYKGKGIRFVGEQIRRKAGKKAGK